MEKEQNVMNVANDIGYGYTKAKLDGEQVKIPSVIARLQPQNINAPLAFGSQQEQDDYFANFLDHLDISISSSEVRDSGRFLVGPAAVNSQLPLTSFDVNDFGGKSEDDLSLILSLSLIAGKRVADAYRAGEPLTEPLQVTVNMATALPVTEGKRKGVEDAYVARYKNQKHTVTFHNFKDPITVTIQFNEVYVGLEGEVALFYLRYSSKEVREKLFSQFKADYPEIAAQVNPNMLVKVTELLGVDIGDGSTDINIFSNGKANAAVSSSLLKGYGNTLNEAIRVLQAEQMNFESRAQLQDYLTQEVTPFAKAHQQRVQQVVYNQLNPFADQILQEVSNVMRQGGTKVALAYVFGGGAVPMHDHSYLPEKLAEKLKRFNGGDPIPVIWLPADLTQIINELALDFVLHQFAKQSKSK